MSKPSFTEGEDAVLEPQTHVDDVYHGTSIHIDHNQEVSFTDLYFI